MNGPPPEHEPPDDLGELYRSASERDPSRPSEATRRAVLAHAERVAAERRGAPRPKRRPLRWQPAAFGTLAAGILVALLIAPRYFAPGVPQVAAPPSRLAADAHPAAAEAKAREAPSVEELVVDARRARANPRSRPAVPAPAAPPAAQSAGETSVIVTGNARAAPPPAQYAAPEAPAAEQSLAGRDTASASSNVRALSALQGGRAAASPRARDVRAEDAGTALRRVAEAGDVAGIEALLAGSVDINARDAQGRTALRLAAGAGQERAVAALLAHGADPNAADSEGITPLAAARAAGNAASIAELERHGAR